jgi:hypothetical protein
MLPRPDCCEKPVLQPLKAIDEAPDGEVVLERCAGCRAYWRVTTQTRMEMSGGDDRNWQTFTRLSELEGTQLLFG